MKALAAILAGLLIFDCSSTNDKSEISKNALPVTNNIIEVKKDSIEQVPKNLIKSEIKGDVHVKGHWRTTKNGKRIWVESHTRSKPKK